MKKKWNHKELYSPTEKNELSSAVGYEVLLHGLIMTPNIINNDWSSLWTQRSDSWNTSSHVKLHSTKEQFAFSSH